MRSATSREVTRTRSRRYRRLGGDELEQSAVHLVEGGPHNVGWTFPDEVNGALLEFIAAKATVTA